MSDRSANSLISIVAPCYNEEAGLPEFVREVSAVMADIRNHYEIVLVNDGSRDATLPVALKLAASDPHIRIINLLRNFGHQAAVTAGLDHAKGDAVILIDSDLQDPPIVIKEMVKLWQKGVDVAYGQRRSRSGESIFKLWTAKLFYRILSRSADRPIPRDTGDFRLMDRCVVDVLKQMRERHRFIRGMVSWVGGRQEAVLYDRAPRFAGDTKYPLAKMLSFAVDAITSFSILPLRLLTYSALSVLGMTFIMGVVIFFTKLINPDSFIPGYASIVLMVMFFGGINLFAFGILGEYIGRTYESIKGRPLYIIDREYPQLMSKPQR